MRIRTDTKGRDETLRLLMQATGEKTKTGALFVAAEHYIADKRNKEDVVDQLDPEIVETLSTRELPMEIVIKTQVGTQTD